MMLRGAVLALCLVCVCSAISLGNKRIVTDELVAEIKAKATTWTPSTDQGKVSQWTYDDVKRMLGVWKNPNIKLPVKVMEDIDLGALPTNFISGQSNWTQCNSVITTIRDQSACGSCWAFGAVEAMTDRICIHLNKNTPLSAAAMAFCATDAGQGCDGGYPPLAWQYWVETGLQTEACWTYPFPSCDHHIPGSKNPCPSGDYNSPSCPTSCPSNSNLSWNDVHYGKNAYSVSGPKGMMQEIYANGPIEVDFSVYEDFLTYKTGVYKHVTGAFLGGHAVKAIGWGVENGVPYWLVNNSWNRNWGNNGQFKILRGSDECGIEDDPNAGMPKN